jgi:hypothetical protein
MFRLLWRLFPSRPGQRRRGEKKNRFRPVVEMLETRFVPAPVAGGAGNTVGYTELQPGVIIDSGLTVTDSGSTTLASATVQVTGSGFAGDGDRLDADGISNGTFNNISVFYDSTTETVTLTGTDTLANYQFLLDHAHFRTTSDNPDNSGSNPTRTVTWVLNDGSASSTPVTTTVNITIVNPDVTSSTANLAIDAATITIAGNGFSTTPSNNAVVFNDGAVGQVTAATATSLTVGLTTAPTSVGSLTAVVTSNSVSSGAAVQVATVVAAPTLTPSTANLTVPTITLTGTNFDSSAANDSVTFTTLGAAGTVTSVNPTGTQMIVTFTTQPTGSGALDATVTSDGGASNTVQVATVLFTDSFTGADSPTLGPSWQLPPSFISGFYPFQYRRHVSAPPVGFQLSGNEAVSAATSWQVAADQAVGVSPLNPTVQADVTPANGSGIGFFARAQSNGDAYVAMLTRDGTGAETAEILLFHGSSGTFSGLDSASVAAPPTTTTLRFTVTGTGSGTTLTLLDAGNASSPTTLVSLTGSALTTLDSAGGVGIFGQGVNSTLDNFALVGS